MKKLIIVAHPNPQGSAHKIAQTFIETSKEWGHDIFLMNLYDAERKQEYLMLGENGKPLPDAKKEAIQEKISRADELVFIFPLWNFDAPAILKNRIDVNFSSGFAFRYKKGSLLPHRFLKGKTARIIFTAGSPKLVVLTAGIGILISRAMARLYYVGIVLRSYTVFGKVPVMTPEQRQQMLAKVVHIARR